MARGGVGEIAAEGGAMGDCECASCWRDERDEG